MSKDVYLNRKRQSDGSIDEKGKPIEKKTRTVRIFLIKKRLKDSAEQVQNKKLYRMYVNCFVPCERPYFHTDGDEGVTFLYYPNMKWDKDDGGETQFLMNDDLYGVLPIPNRMVVFSANLLHRATTFRNDHRFTVAIKYI